MLNALYHSLNPVAFSIGPFSVHWYGIAYLAGFLCAGFTMYRVARHWKINLTSDDILMIGICAAFGLIVGARIFYVVFYGAGYYVKHPLEVFMLNQGGMSFHGGLVGALIGGYVACRLQRLSFVSTVDLACIGAPFGLLFGRCANFVNGELWGKPTDLPWGVMFPSGGNVMRHPSQLYEAFLEGLVLLIILYALSRKLPARPQGTFIGVFLTFYGIFRFLVEFVRVPDEQLGYLFGPITMGQCLSLPLVIVGIVVIVWARRSGRPQRGHIPA